MTRGRKDRAGAAVGSALFAAAGIALVLVAAVDLLLRCPRRMDLRPAAARDGEPVHHG